jgi:uncharacterized protein (TIGR02246 family)
MEATTVLQAASRQPHQPGRHKIMTQQSTTEITQVLENVYKAWEDNDANAFVADYTEDAVAILPGQYHSGKEGVRKSFTGAFAGPLKGSSTVNKLISVREYGPDTAIVNSESGIMFAGETEVPDARMVLATWVLVKQDGKWKVASYHNSPRDAAH